ncbi:alkaline phosphatase D family protein [soil metagenome]
MGIERSMVDPLRVSRKDFVRMGGLGVAAVVLGVEASADRAFADPRFSSNPFTLGVASGDPIPDGVVLWTRLLTAEGEMPNQKVRVRWKVATEENMRTVVKSGEVFTGPDRGYSVHVDVRGLKTDRDYFYTFRVGDYVSPVGRTRTTPGFGASPKDLAFGFVSCQDYQNGFYAAYGAMARQEQDLAFVLHLGDYIYEYGPSETAVPTREHNGPEIITLADYRKRHALYKSDEDMREAHRMFPFIVTFDDHEIENNYADAIPEDGSETPTMREFLRRRAAGYKAYYENMPLRPSSMPQGPDMRLYRRFNYGDLAQFSVLDTRQYRTNQPCGDGFKERCARALSERQTMTGPEQERWLKEGMNRSQARWNVTAQQTMLAEYDFSGAPDDQPEGESFNMDQWDGYVAARNRLISFFDRSGVSNPITLTGDIHSAWVHDLKTDFEDETSRTVGTEFVGTSITSSFPGVFIPVVEGARPDNPHTKFFDGANRGYTRCDLNRKRYLTTFKAIPTEPGLGSVVTPESASTTLAAFVVENGKPGATQVEGQTTPTSSAQGEIDQGYQQLAARKNW